MTSDAPIAGITAEITANGVEFFIKGTPRCSRSGLSAITVASLAQIEIPFKGVNVPANEEIQMGAKAFWDWPTIPHLYVKGEFDGGCDIVREICRSDGLQELLKNKEMLPHDQKYHRLRGRGHLGREPIKV
jgi:monothiol glutaredoxin